MEKYLKLQLQLKHDISRKITQEIISLTIDIGIVVNPIRHPDLIIQKLRNDEVTFWVGVGGNTDHLRGSKEVLFIGF